MGYIDVAFDFCKLRDHQSAGLVARGGYVALHMAVDAQAASEGDVALDCRAGADEAVDRAGLVRFSEHRASLQQIDRPGQFNLSPGERQNPYLGALEGASVGDGEMPLDLLVEAEFHRAGGFPGGCVRKGRCGYRPVLVQAGEDLHLALEILLSLAALRKQHAVAEFVRLAVALDLQVGKREALRRRARRHDVAQESEVFLEPRVLVLELRHRAGQLALRGLLDLQLPVALDERGLRGLEVLAQSLVFFRKARDALAHLLDVGSRDAIAVLHEPPHHGRHHGHHQHVQGPAPVPRELRADRHPRGADPEAAADAAADASHQGTTASCRRPSVSAKPNMRFMFCTAWPAAPLTRLSSTASTTSVSASRGRWTAMRTWLVPRTHRVSGWEPGGSTSTNGSFAKRFS